MRSRAITAITRAAAITCAAAIGCAAATTGAATIGVAAALNPRQQPRTAVKKLTPVLLVREIEPVLPFWTDRLGFEKTTEVPEGDRLGFVILQKGAVEVMYQTRESVENDVPELADTPMRGALLFIQVDDLDAVERALEGIEPVTPRRQTFYGADELIVREPAGNVVTFAEFGED